MDDQQQSQEEEEEEVSLNWITSSSHPEHNLKEVFKNSKFKCKVCKSKGLGARYRCDLCEVDIHAGCETCPNFLSSFTHPEHELVLMPKPNLIHKCHLCRGIIHGKAYSQFPQLLGNHPKHPPHPLRLQSEASKKCDVCEGKCKHWRYYCEACDVHIHVGCLSRDKIGGKRLFRKLASEIIKEAIFNSTIGV
ncbi:hypothetical protein Cgig2_023846 [Carnegiea gigantea]|uniref:DC1 domain-containing protein n=1 Tax=Carnegiea gigantea TaxID=171969 RepID=A0A9Q1K9I8_9CARY|nr:hypothetical protein Cgig2_023846 [Carnegiea gigantea]